VVAFVRPYRPDSVQNLAALSPECAWATSAASSPTPTAVLPGGLRSEASRSTTAPRPLTCLAQYHRGLQARYTATVVYQGQTLTQTLTVTCEPATTDECKNGGWRGFFGVFKSQGSCVSFVAAKGKSQPSGP
jgi:hypothetical protein